MDKLDILIWMMGGGFAIIFALMIIMWGFILKRFDKIDQEIKDINTRLNAIENRISIIETVLKCDGWHVFNRGDEEKKRM